MIDYDAIKLSFIKSIRELVGDRLSTQPRKVNGVIEEVPSVIKVRNKRNAKDNSNKNPKPDYPYITVDIIDTQKEDGYLKESGVREKTALLIDNNNNNVIDENYNEFAVAIGGCEFFMRTDYRMFVQVKVYGGDALSIANSLESKYRYDPYRSQIEIETGGVIKYINSISSTPDLLATEYAEGATFNIEFGICDEDIIDNPDYFDKVSIQGKLLGYKGDIDPLIVVI